MIMAREDSIHLIVVQQIEVFFAVFLVDVGVRSWLINRFIEKRVMCKKQNMLFIPAFLKFFCKQVIFAFVRAFPIWP